jgi:hypothetical protein
VRSSPHDRDDPGKPWIAWDDKAAREALVSALANSEALGHDVAVGEPLLPGRDDAGVAVDVGPAQPAASPAA